MPHPRLRSPTRIIAVHPTSPRTPVIEGSIGALPAQQFLPNYALGAIGIPPLWLPLVFLPQTTTRVGVSHGFLRLILGFLGNFWIGIGKNYRGKKNAAAKSSKIPIKSRIPQEKSKDFPGFPLKTPQKGAAVRFRRKVARWKTKLMDHNISEYWCLKSVKG
mgnify:CR=1 FL=1